MKKIVVVFAAALATAAIAVTPAFAAEVKVAVCHAAGQAGSTQFVGLLVPGIPAGDPNPTGAQGHFTEGGTPEAGHEEDIFLGVATKKPSTAECNAASTTGGTTTTTGGTTTTTGGTTTTTGGTTTTTGGTTGTGGAPGTTGGTTGGTAPTPSGGNLPFTGLPVWMPLLAAAAMLGSGIFLLRRRTVRPPQRSNL